MISTHNTLDILVNSSVKQKLNLLLGHTYLANVYEITEDGKVIIQIGENKLIAETKVPLLPGDKIYVQVKENNDNIILLQVMNKLESQEIVKNQQILFRNSIINTLENLRIPIKEENIGISQKLIQYNLNVSTENIHKVSNILINAGYQDSLKDIDILDKGVFLFSKGIPINNQTMDLAAFLRGNRGQVTEKISTIDQNLDIILDTLEGESFISPKYNINNLTQENNDLLELNYLKEESGNEVTGKLQSNQDLDSIIVNKNNNSFNDNELDTVDKLQNNKEIFINKSNDDEIGMTIKQNNDFLTNKINNQESKNMNMTGSIEIIDKALELDNSLISTISNNTNDITNNIGKKDSDIKLSNINQQETINPLFFLKKVISDLIIRIDSSNQNSESQIEILKNIANLVTDGSRNLDSHLFEKYKLSQEDISSFIKNILVAKDLSQNSSHQHNNIIRVLQEHNTLINQNFAELNKHFEAIKLYNSSNYENNNFYLLPVPIEVAGRKFDNKIYFWSKGNKQSKIDPENMRIVFILNTLNLGLLKIDITVVKRDVYAGIEVSDPKVKNLLDNYRILLQEQLAAINYGLRKVNCEVKKEDNIISHQDNYLTDKDLTTLDLRI